ncbi:fumarylacetoacetate hydrolase family protein [Donghicola mangrovi]|uniref:Fumarylacetoacetate hydrolase family protein n=1 Tax=Donghicola mangrovi TaxID=2729614 RepID=A0A850QIE1_9RHOB|nr:fumarylacetoacetate hydrolase family protein [Donghicola mangrovi]NVO25561.1 fumarylacetoacetate hydrolase family protein [Donghicola mangrovi]
MKLARFTQGGNTRIGKVEGDRVVDLSGLPGVGTSMRALIRDLETLRPALEAATAPSYALAEVVLQAPVNDPQKFLAIGMNYRKHAEEARQAGIPVPDSQFWFTKQVSCVNGPTGDVVKPSFSNQMDYEIELGMVIGRACRNVTREEAPSVIAGYMIVNDVSVRDWQKPSFTIGKSFDTSGPTGPWLTTADEVADPLALEMVGTVNGEERQRSMTGDMIYDIYDQIVHLTRVMTLMPGDIIATGTPSGIGAAQGKFLKSGDVMRMEITGLGQIENRVIADAGAEAPSSCDATVPA